MKTYDLIIIGAGPVGLYAGFYAGMRGLNVALIEAFDQAGGQPQTLYPEKKIYDIAGLPEISGLELTNNLLKQLDRIEYALFTGENVEKIEPDDQEEFTVTTDKATYKAKSVLLTTGAGLLSPRKIGLPYEEELYDAKKLSYFIDSLEDFRDQSVAVLGGGDSAVDWALSLENVAKEVHLVHRRTAFRAHEKSVEELKASSINIHVPYTISALSDDQIELNKTKSEEKTALTFDKILVNYGFLTNRLDILDQLEMSRNGKIIVNSQMKSNIDGIYGAGDGVEYAGKVPLMSAGFGEAVTAINALSKVIKLDHSLRKGHSSSLFG